MEHYKRVRNTASEIMYLIHLIFPLMLDITIDMCILIFLHLPYKSLRQKLLNFTHENALLLGLILDKIDIALSFE